MSQKRAVGTGEEEVLLTCDCAPLTWTRDGRSIIYGMPDANAKWDLFVLPLSGDFKPVRLTNSPFDTSQAQLLPDGKWIAYVSNEPGVEQLYVQKFPLTANSWQISTQGGRHPRSRQDGNELFFISPDKSLMAVELKRTESLQVGTPKDSPGLIGVTATDYSERCQTALEKVGPKLGFPDNFFKSQTEIHNFRTALAKVVQQFRKVGRKSQKFSDFLKSRTETGNCRRKFTISVPHFGFPSGFFQSCPEFEKVRRLSKKLGNFRQSRPAFAISGELR